MGFANGITLPNALSSIEPILWLLQIYRAIGIWIFLALYLLTTFSLFVIAKRRRIWRPWLAFLPFGSIWILGCISDQYQYARHGLQKKRRTLLVVLELLCLILCIALCLSTISAYQQLMDELDKIYRFSDLIAEAIEALEGATILAILSGCALLTCGIAKWCCCYRLFASCDPDNKFVYLIFGLIFPWLVAVFLFLCRKKDLGMSVPGERTQA